MIGHRWGMLRKSQSFLCCQTSTTTARLVGARENATQPKEWSINENSGRQYLLHLLVSTTKCICAKSHKYIVCLWQCEFDITSNQHCVTVGLGVGHNTFYSLCGCSSVGVGHHPLALSNTVCLCQCGSGTSHLSSVQHCVPVAVWEWDITP